MNYVQRSHNNDRIRHELPQIASCDNFRRGLTQSYIICQTTNQITNRKTVNTLRIREAFAVSAETDSAPSRTGNKQPIPRYFSCYLEVLQRRSNWFVVSTQTMQQRVGTTDSPTSRKGLTSYYEILNA